MMTEDIAQDIAQNIFSEYLGANKQKFTLLAGDASTRQYYRYKFPNPNNSSGASENLILAYYPGKNSLASLKRFVFWQKAYVDKKITVPKIYGIDEKNQLILQEDIGDCSLQMRLGLANQETEFKYLQQAIDNLALVRDLNAHNYEGSIPAFTLEKLQFEIQHTLTYFVGHYLGKTKEIELTRKLWMPLLERLSKIPMHLCHRDYHSRNLMLAQGHLYVIDFQDTMLGPIQYDLCSLLDDCYIKYHPAVYQKVMRNFFDQVVSDKHHVHSYEEFFVNYHLVKLQRQYKAIGSFSYVWVDKNNAKFLRYISYVMESMKASFEALSMPELAPLKEKVLTLYYES